MRFILAYLWAAVLSIGSVNGFPQDTFRYPESEMHHFRNDSLLEIEDFENTYGRIVRSYLIQDEEYLDFMCWKYGRGSFYNDTSLLTDSIPQDCSHQETVWRNPHDCSKYMVCASSYKNGIKNYLLYSCKCQQSTLFSLKESKCDKTENVHDCIHIKNKNEHKAKSYAVSSSAIKNIPNILTSNVPDFHSPDGFGKKVPELDSECLYMGKFPLENYCDRYIQCITGPNGGLEARLFACPRGQHYSKNYRICMHAYLARCPYKQNAVTSQNLHSSPFSPTHQILNNELVTTSAPHNLAKIPRWPPTPEYSSPVSPAYQTLQNEITQTPAPQNVAKVPYLSPMPDYSPPFYPTPEILINDMVTTLAPQDVTKVPYQAPTLENPSPLYPAYEIIRNENGTTLAPPNLVKVPRPPPTPEDLPLYYPTHEILKNEKLTTSAPQDSEKVQYPPPTTTYSPSFYPDYETLENKVATTSAPQNSIKVPYPPPTPEYLPSFYPTQKILQNEMVTTSASQDLVKVPYPPHTPEYSLPFSPTHVILTNETVTTSAPPNVVNVPYPFPTSVYSPPFSIIPEILINDMITTLAPQNVIKVPYHAPTLENPPPLYPAYEIIKNENVTTSASPNLGKVPLPPSMPKHSPTFNPPYEILNNKIVTTSSPLNLAKVPFPTPMPEYLPPFYSAYEIIKNENITTLAPQTLLKVHYPSHSPKYSPPLYPLYKVLNSEKITTSAPQNLVKVLYHDPTSLYPPPLYLDYEILRNEKVTTSAPPKLVKVPYKPPEREYSPAFYSDNKTFQNKMVTSSASQNPLKVPHPSPMPEYLPPFYPTHENLQNEMVPTSTPQNSMKVSYASTMPEYLPLPSPMHEISQNEMLITSAPQNFVKVPYPPPTAEYVPPFYPTHAVLKNGMVTISTPQNSMRGAYPPPMPEHLPPFAPTHQILQNEMTTTSAPQNFVKVPFPPPTPEYKDNYGANTGTNEFQSPSAEHKDDLQVSAISNTFQRKQVSVVNDVKAPGSLSTYAPSEFLELSAFPRNEVSTLSIYTTTMIPHIKRTQDEFLQNSSDIFNQSRRITETKYTHQYHTNFPENQHRYEAIAAPVESTRDESKPNVIAEYKHQEENADKSATKNNPQVKLYDSFENSHYKHYQYGLPSNDEKLTHNRQDAMHELSNNSSQNLSDTEQPYPGFKNQTIQNHKGILTTPLEFHHPSSENYGEKEQFKYNQGTQVHYEGSHPINYDQVAPDRDNNSHSISYNYKNEDLPKQNYDNFQPPREQQEQLSETEGQLPPYNEQLPESFYLPGQNVHQISETYTEIESPQNNHGQQLNHGRDVPFMYDQFTPENYPSSQISSYKNHQEPPKGDSYFLKDVDIKVPKYEDISKNVGEDKLSESKNQHFSQTIAEELPSKYSKQNFSSHEGKDKPPNYYENHHVTQEVEDTRPKYDEHHFLKHNEDANPPNYDDYHFSKTVGEEKLLGHEDHYFSTTIDQNKPLEYEDYHFSKDNEDGPHSYDNKYFPKQIHDKIPTNYHDYHFAKSVVEEKPLEYNDYRFLKNEGEDNPLEYTDSHFSKNANQEQPLTYEDHFFTSIENDKLPRYDAHQNDFTETVDKDKLPSYDRYQFSKNSDDKPHNYNNTQYPFKHFEEDKYPTHDLYHFIENAEQVDPPKYDQHSEDRRFHQDDHTNGEYADVNLPTNDDYADEIDTDFIPFNRKVGKQQQIYKGSDQEKQYGNPETEPFAVPGELKEKLPLLDKESLKLYHNGELHAQDFDVSPPMQYTNGKDFSNVYSAYDHHIGVHENVEYPRENYKELSNSDMSLNFDEYKTPFDAEVAPKYQDGHLENLNDYQQSMLFSSKNSDFEDKPLKYLHQESPNYPYEEINTKSRHLPPALWFSKNESPLLSPTDSHNEMPPTDKDIYSNNPDTDHELMHSDSKPLSHNNMYKSEQFLAEESEDEDDEELYSLSDPILSSNRHSIREPFYTEVPTTIMARVHSENTPTSNEPVYSGVQTPLDRPMNTVTESLIQAPIHTKGHTSHERIYIEDQYTKRTPPQFDKDQFVIREPVYNIAQLPEPKSVYSGKEQSLQLRLVSFKDKPPTTEPLPEQKYRVTTLPASEYLSSIPVFPTAENLKNKTSPIHPEVPPSGHPQQNTEDVHYQPQSVTVSARPLIPKPNDDNDMHHIPTEVSTTAAPIRNGNPVYNEDLPPIPESVSGSGSVNERVDNEYSNHQPEFHSLSTEDHSPTGKPENSENLQNIPQNVSTGKSPPILEPVHFKNLHHKPQPGFTEALPPIREPQNTTNLHYQRENVSTEERPAILQPVNNYNLHTSSHLVNAKDPIHESLIVEQVPSVGKVMSSENQPLIPKHLKDTQDHSNTPVLSKSPEAKYQVPEPSYSHPLYLNPMYSNQMSHSRKLAYSEDQPPIKPSMNIETRLNTPETLLNENLYHISEPAQAGNEPSIISPIGKNIPTPTRSPLYSERQQTTGEFVYSGNQPPTKEPELVPTYTEEKHSIISSADSKDNILNSLQSMEKPSVVEPLHKQDQSSIVHSYYPPTVPESPNQHQISKEPMLTEKPVFVYTEDQPPIETFTYNEENPLIFKEYKQQYDTQNNRLPAYDNLPPPRVANAPMPDHQNISLNNIHLQEPPTHIPDKLYYTDEQPPNHDHSQLLYPKEQSPYHINYKLLTTNEELPAIEPADSIFNQDLQHQRGHSETKLMYNNDNLVQYKDEQPPNHNHQFVHTDIGPLSIELKSMSDDKNLSSADYPGTLLEDKTTLAHKDQKFVYSDKEPPTKNDYTYVNNDEEHPANYHIMSTMYNEEDRPSIDFDRKRAYNNEDFPSVDDIPSKNSNQKLDYNNTEPPSKAIQKLELNNSYQLTPRNHESISSDEENPEIHIEKTVNVDRKQPSDTSKEYKLKNPPSMQSTNYKPTHINEDENLFKPVQQTFVYNEKVPPLHELNKSEYGNQDHLANNHQTLYIEKESPFSTTQRFPDSQDRTLEDGYVESHANKSDGPGYNFARHHRTEPYEITDVDDITPTHETFELKHNDEEPIRDNHHNPVADKAEALHSQDKKFLDRADYHLKHDHSDPTLLYEIVKPSVSHHSSSNLGDKPKAPNHHIFVYNEEIPTVRSRMSHSSDEFYNQDQNEAMFDPSLDSMEQFKYEQMAGEPPEIENKPSSINSTEPFKSVSTDVRNDDQTGIRYSNYDFSSRMKHPFDTQSEVESDGFDSNKNAVPSKLYQDVSNYKHINPAPYLHNQSNHDHIYFPIQPPSTNEQIPPAFGLPTNFKNSSESVADEIQNEHYHHAVMPIQVYPVPPNEKCNLTKAENPPTQVYKESGRIAQKDQLDYGLMYSSRRNSSRSRRPHKLKNHKSKSQSAQNRRQKKPKRNLNNDAQRKANRERVENTSNYQAYNHNNYYKQTHHANSMLPGTVLERKENDQLLHRAREPEPYSNAGSHDDGYKQKDIVPP